MDLNFDDDILNQIQETEEVKEPEKTVKLSKNITTETVDSQMNEVERRLEVAQYYRLLLNDNIFQDNSFIAQQVESEIKVFVRERLGVLLGVNAPKEQENSDFTEQEVSVLKTLASNEVSSTMLALTSKLLKKPIKEIAVESSKPKAPKALKKIKEPSPAGINTFKSNKKETSGVPSEEVVINENGEEVIIKRDPNSPKPRVFKKFTKSDGTEGVKEITAPTVAPEIKRETLQTKAQIQAAYSRLAHNGAAATQAVFSKKTGMK